MRPATNPTALRVQAQLDALGMGHQIVEFEQTTRTAADAAAAIGCAIGQIVKTLVFRGASSGGPGPGRRDNGPASENWRRLSASRSARPMPTLCGRPPVTPSAACAQVGAARERAHLYRSGSDHLHRDLGGRRRALRSFRLTPVDLGRMTSGRVAPLAV